MRFIRIGKLFNCVEKSFNRDGEHENARGAFDLNVYNVFTGLSVRN